MAAGDDGFAEGGHAWSTGSGEVLEVGEGAGEELVVGDVEGWGGEGGDLVGEDVEIFEGTTEGRGRRNFKNAVAMVGRLMSVGVKWARTPRECFF